jgi:uncharacterized protein involved in type VI secretion and phage assembly
MELEKVVADLIQRVERRYFGKYRGVVVDNADPERLGRLKVKVPSVLGADVVTGWALPCAPYGGDANQGFFFIPETGAGVWVEFEEGDLEFPIWVGTYWSKPGGDSEVPKPNATDGTEDGAVQDPPTCKTIKSLKGHTLQFEDADDARVTLYEGANQQVITLDANGITIMDKFGNQVVTTDQGITLTDKSGNSVKMDGSSGNNGAPGIDLNGGTRVCLQGLVDWLLGHQHVGNMGAPTPLFPADMATLQAKMNVPGAGILSDTVKAK